MHKMKITCSSIICTRRMVSNRNQYWFLVKHLLLILDSALRSSRRRTLHGQLVVKQDTLYLDDLAIKAGLGYSDLGLDGVDGTFNWKFGGKYYIGEQFPVGVRLKLVSTGR